MYGECLTQGDPRSKASDMILKCPRCGGGLDITGFEGSAVHTRCSNPGCQIEARPRSKKPPNKKRKFVVLKERDSNINNIISNIDSRKPKSKKKQRHSEPPVVLYRKSFASIA